MRNGLMLLLGLAVASAGGVAWLTAAEQPGTQPSDPAKETSVKQLMEDGQYRRVIDEATPTLIDPAADDAARAELVSPVRAATEKLGQQHEFDALLEQVTDRGPRLRVAIAHELMELQHTGVLRDGEFIRGSGGGRWVDVQEEDRAAALIELDALLGDANPFNEISNDSELLKALIQEARRAISESRYGGDYWRLQTLTDLTTPPDYLSHVEDSAEFMEAAPVDADGQPLVFAVPDSWTAAASDGERLAWIESQMTARPKLFDVPKLRLDLATADRQRYGVGTLGSLSGQIAESVFKGLDGPGEAVDKTAGLLMLPTLGENETVCRLATGVRRFELPQAINFLQEFRELRTVDDKRVASRAAMQLADELLDRMQYEQAAAVLAEALPGLTERERKRATRTLAQIVEPRGDFRPQPTTPAGQSAQVEVRFRNATSVSLSAAPVDTAAMLGDIKDRLRREPKTLDYDQMSPDVSQQIFPRRDGVLGAIGELLGGTSTRYVREPVADWSVDLNPRPGHFDRIVPVTTPLQQGGVYLLTARFTDDEDREHVSRTLVWVADLAIVTRPLLGGGLQVFVADALTGQPVAGATVTLFGRSHQHRRTDRWRVKEHTKTTDAGGFVTLSPDETRAPGRKDTTCDFLIEASAGDRGGWLGWDNMASSRAMHDTLGRPRQTTTTGVVDRPIYRPGDVVRFHTWAGTADYADPTMAAGRAEVIELVDPQHDVIDTRVGKRDPDGGFGGEFTLPADAKLGGYRIRRKRGETLATFRLEEYRKPEFEVRVETPDGSIPTLGQTVPVTIAADYYAGGPVSQGTVHVTVKRSEKSVSLYPSRPWDWLFGDGYIWRAVAFHDGGDNHFGRHWHGWHEPDEEVVLDQTLDLGPGGTAQVEIDTTLVAELYGGSHEYRITAEVTDLSRRIETGRGSVIVAEQPFSVGVWTDGYGTDGRATDVTITARTPAGDGIDGTAELRLVRLTREGKRIVREDGPVQSVDVADGTATVAVSPDLAGIYDIVVSVTADGTESPQPGQARWIVRGEELTDASPDGELTITTDQPTYAPGETATLLVNAPQSRSHVLAWVLRAHSEKLAANRKNRQVLERLGGKFPPQKDPGQFANDYGDFIVVPIRGGSGTLEVPITAADMPNRFVEFCTISEGEVLVQTVELYVPPTEQSLTITATPDREEYRPGDEAEVALTVTDADGRPVELPLVVSVYDRSVDAVAGGPDSRQLREIYWSWKRSHRAVYGDNLRRVGFVIRLPGEEGLTTLGQFGDWNDQIENVQQRGRAAAMMRKGGGVGGVGGGYGGGYGGEADGAVMDSFIAEAAPAALAELEVDRRSPEAATASVAARTTFADTAFWSTDIRTTGDGTASVTVPFPDNLTDWSIRVWGVSAQVQVGQTTASARVSKDLLVRLQTPRFLTDTDAVDLTATIQNKAAVDVVVDVALEVVGPLTLTGEAQPIQTVTVPAASQTRVTWPALADGLGEASLIVKAASRSRDGYESESDGLKVTLPVQVHGTEKVETWAGVIRESDPARTIAFTIPADRRPEDSRLELRVSPSLAGSIVDALPYLADYPYGCTEQTLNRFLPAAITQHTLAELDIRLADLAATRLNPTQRDGGVPAWQRWSRSKKAPEAVFDEAIVGAMTREGVDRLAEMQLSDGGWGWFSGYGEWASPHTTAVVVRGLQQARAAGVDVPDDVLAGGVRWLDRYQKEQVRLLQNDEAKRAGEVSQLKPRQRSKSQASTLDALVAVIRAEDAGLTPTVTDREMLRFLYRDRLKLTPYGLALIGVALHQSEPNGERLAMVVDNLDQFLIVDDENATAYLDIPDRFSWWSWTGDEIETIAWGLKLYTRVRPDDPRTAGLATYLVQNRRHGTYWSSTRDTALAVESLAEYLTTTDELNPDLTLEIAIDGKPAKTVRITRENRLDFDGTLVLEGEELTAGEHTLTISRRGRGPAYYGLTVANFTLEEFITKAGLDARVERRLWHLKPRDTEVDGVSGRGGVVAQKVEDYDRVALDPRASLPTGELIEVELLVTTKNDFEYLVVEDFKPAGCEAVEPRSGYRVLGGRSVYVEFRENRTAMFLRSAPRGTLSLTYRLRTEQLGRYSALPAEVRGMYAPDLRGNSDEAKLTVTDVEASDED